MLAVQETLEVKWTSNSLLIVDAVSSIKTQIEFRILSQDVFLLQVEIPEEESPLKPLEPWLLLRSKISRSFNHEYSGTYVLESVLSSGEGGL